MAAHQFHASVLREYDIRGIVGETLSVSDARAVGRAFGSAVIDAGGRRIAIGYDGRMSSPDFEVAAVEGLVASGLEVFQIGRGPTPMLYFAVHHLGCDAGLMVTGSHNPGHHNGFKMVRKGKPFYGQDIKALGRRAALGDYVSGSGKTQSIDLMEDYVRRLARDFSGQRRLKVAWDAGNGAAGEAMTRLASHLPGEHILLFADIDGRFPNHHPDPTVPENLTDLIKTVREKKCDIGVAFDGDGDRLGVVDGLGRILWGDQMLALLSRDVLARNPGAPIIADVKASRMLFEEVARLGGRPIMWKTGHSLIKAKMQEEGAPLAGEMSAHIFFADGFYGHDDALYATVRLLSLIARGDRSLADLRDELPAMVNTPELRFDCPDDEKFKIIEKVRARLAETGAKVNAIDGVRVDTADGWWLLRASNTQAVLVARCEAGDESGLGRVKAELIATLRSAGIEPPAAL